MRALKTLGVCIFLLAAGCSDDQPPVFLSTTVLYDTADTVGPYVVMTSVVDDKGLDSITLYYFTTPYDIRPVTMTTVGQDRYAATIPGQAVGTTVGYYLTGTDVSGNQACDPAGSCQLQEVYVFRVLGQQGICQVDADCPVGQFCQAGGACRAFQEWCALDEDCPRGMICDPWQGICIASARDCLSDGDCLPGEWCQGDACAAQPSCVTNDDCPPELVCHRGLGLCTRPCVSDGHCLPGEHCLDGLCEPPECLDHGDCPIDEICNPETWLCDPPPVPCPSDAYCPLDTLCHPTSGLCVQCLDDLDCPSSSICLQDSHTCIVVDCLADWDCPNGQICIDSLCQAPSPCLEDCLLWGMLCHEASGECVECLEDIHCLAGFFCSEGSRCLPRPEGGELCEPCATDWDCGGPEDLCVEGFCGQACDRDGDCPPLFACFSRQCVPQEGRCDALPECLEDGHCPEGQVCRDRICVVRPEPGGLCDPCLVDEDCGPDDLCITLFDGDFCALRCSDDPCPWGFECLEHFEGIFLCVPSERTCLDRRCLIDDDCALGLFCLEGYCQPSESCVADPLEPNDDVPSAVESGPLPEGLTLCPLDVDRYVIQAEVGDVIHGEAFSLTSSLVWGAAEAYIEGPDGGRMYASVMGTSLVATWFQVVQPGPHIFVVAALTVPMEGVSYQGSLTAGNAQQCLPDAFEANDSRETATVVGEGGLPALRLCQDDDDWFLFEAPGGTTLHVEFTSFEMVPLRAGLYDGAGNLLLFGEGRGHVGLEWHDIPETAPFYISLKGDVAPEGTSYSGEIEFTPPSCQDDTLEENDEMALATAIEAGLTTGLWLCEGDPDWYTFWGEDREGMRLHVTTATEGAFSLELYSAQGMMLASAQSQGGEGSLAAESLPYGGAYFVHIQATGEVPLTGLGYEIILSFPSCADDPFEENDTLDGAAPVDIEAGVAAVLCPGDPDWFVLEAEGGQVLTVVLQGGEGWEMELYHQDGRLLASAEREGEVWRLVRDTLIGTNPYYLRVGGEGGEYGLQFALECRNDTHEPNDAWQEARDVEAGPLPEGLRLCPGDEDWFTFDGVMGSTVTIMVMAEDHVAMELNLLKDGQMVGLGLGQGRVTLGPMVIAEGGSYALGVTGQAPAQGVGYEGEVRIIPPPLCAPDDLEPNDTQELAVEVETGPLPGGLTLCPGDKDCFAFLVPEGARVGVMMEAGSNIFVEGELYGPSGELLDQRQAEGTLELGAVEVDGGTMIFCVSGSPPAEGVSYQAYVEVMGEECHPDAYEPNDTWSDAAFLTRPGGLNLTLCPSDQDWFSFTASPGPASVEVTGEGSMEVLVYTPAGAPVAHEISDTGFLSLTTELTINGTFRVLIQGALEGYDYRAELRWVN